MTLTSRFFACTVMIGMLVLGSAMLVCANQSPIAIALPDNQTIYAGEEAWFSGNDSYDPDGNIESYFWDFQDGTYSSESNTTHVYNNPGNYTVILTVTDDLGAKDQDYVNVTVLELPQENTTVWIDSLTTEKQEYNVTETINTTVIIKRDYGNGPPVWEGTLIFEVFNDAMVLVYNDVREIFLSDVAVSEISYFDFNLTEVGEYLVRASLYDNASVFVEKKEIDISITQEPQNQLPIAIVNSDGEIFDIGESVRFYGHLSYDPDGFIASYVWEFGDGNSGSGMNVSYTYNIPGNYTIILTVKDNFDAINTDIVTVIVSEPENEPPIPHAKPDIQRINVGEEAWFYGHLSYDPDGFIISYHWDLGDGNFKSGVNISHVYDFPGNYSVTLTVTDNEDATFVDIITVEVVESGGGLSDENKPSNEESSHWNTFLLAIAAAGILSIFTIFFGTEAGRYRFFGFLVPLYTRLKKKEILDHFTRGKIYGYILANPGDHYNSIKKALDLSDGTFSHHIHILEKEGIIKSAREGIYRCFYPAGMRIPSSENSLKKSQLIIIEKIKETPGISQKDIASLLGVSSPTVNYHLKELLKLGIIESERAGMRLRYFVNAEKEDIEVEIIPKGKLKKARKKEFIDYS
ncbi:MAG: PKD domain-containing protein [Thermoplasmata archaeon]|nr:MAG: PKD domain-containing protein [Thermoplasmata archaeon]